MDKRIMYVIAAIVVIAVIAVSAYWLFSGTTKANASSCIQCNASSATLAPETVTNGSEVSVFYTGSFTNNTIFNTNVGNVTPFTFTEGSGQVITGFNNAVLGMRVNQSTTVTIPANEAYGPVNPAMIVSVPVNAFGNESIEVGQAVGENINGQVARGTILAINATNVTVDFNSPFAGKTLVFTIKVVGITKNSTA
jgi:peptidylprolyl isomerase